MDGKIGHKNIANTVRQLRHHMKGVYLILTCVNIHLCYTLICNLNSLHNSWLQQLVLKLLKANLFSNKSKM